MKEPWQDVDLKNLPLGWKFGEWEVLDANGKQVLTVEQSVTDKVAAASLWLASFAPEMLGRLKDLKAELNSLSFKTPKLDDLLSRIERGPE